MPARHLRLDTIMLAWATASACPSAAANSAPRNHSWNDPRSSRCTTGVCTHAPSMLSGFTASDRRTKGRFDCLFLAFGIAGEEHPSLEGPEPEHHGDAD